MVSQIQDDIEQKLRQAFAPEFLLVENESHRHNVPLHAATHFKVTVVSKAFQGKNLLQRHREVYETLSQEMTKGGVHALALHAYTPLEWERRSGQAPASPLCRGGGKGENK